MQPAGTATSRDPGPPAPVAAGRLLRNREFVGLLTSKAVSVLGDQLARVALTVLVYDRTRSTALAALTYALTLLPVIVGSPLLGGLADRTPPRRLLVTVDLARAALYALMATPHLPTVALLALLTTATVVGAPWAAARQPLLRDVLSGRPGPGTAGGEGAYQRGSGLDETLEQTGQVAGFALGGLLLVAVGAEAALLGDAASFVVSAAAVRLLVRPRPAAVPTAEDPTVIAAQRRGRVRRSLGDARTGWQVALASPTRRVLLLTWLGLAAGIAPDAVAVPWAAHLHAGPTAVGLLYAASSVGTALALPVVARAGRDRSRTLLLPLAGLSLLPLLGCAADPPLPVVVALLVVSGAGGTFSLLARTAFQRGLGTRPEARGRAFAVAAAGVTAGQGVGAGLAGLVGTALSPPTTVAVLAAVALAAGAALVAVTDRPAP